MKLSLTFFKFFNIFSKTYIMPANIYVPQAFKYIADNQPKIRDFAIRYNVAPTAVAVFITKENNSYETTN